jgi:hypothetical protein
MFLEVGATNEVETYSWNEERKTVEVRVRVKYYWVRVRVRVRVREIYT